MLSLPAGLGTGPSSELKHAESSPESPESLGRAPVTGHSQPEPCDTPGALSRATLQGMGRTAEPKPNEVPLLDAHSASEEADWATVT